MCSCVYSVPHLPNQTMQRHALFAWYHPPKCKIKAAPEDTESQTLGRVLRGEVKNLGKIHTNT